MDRHADNARAGGDRRSGSYPRHDAAARPADGAPTRPAPDLDAAPGTTPMRLARLVAAYRHDRGLHDSTHLDARQRRVIDQRLSDTEHWFDRQLDESVTDPDDRAAWRAALHGHAPIPGIDASPASRLVFRGVTNAGGRVEVVERLDGQHAIMVDGVERERIVDRFAIPDPQDGVVVIAGLHVRERFAASEPAVGALAAFSYGGGRPPWQHIDELADDGLIDEQFAVTPRGRRALARSATVT
jgi:hypothetical protein